jgi:GNAT superfamily N-acetyltransferase
MMSCEAVSPPRIVAPPQSSRRPAGVQYRPALLNDSLEIARFICMAGEGLYEFLFDDVVPFVTAAEFLAAGVASADQPISHRNCFVAIDGVSGDILGAANAFPADLLKPGTYPFVPEARQSHIAPMLRLQDWGSMFLNALAVEADCRGLGIGSHLLDWAKRRTRAQGFARLSLHVWADNGAARRLYAGHGFVERGIAHLASDPRLADRGGSVLMSLAV